MLRKFFAILLLSCFTLSAFAQSATMQLTTLLQNLHTMQANFAQVINDNNGNIVQQSSGRMALQRPGLFRWDTSQPNQQLIIADGKNIWIYDKDLAQITKQRQNTSANAPGLLLSDSVDQLAKRFRIEAMNNNPSAFKLIPVQRDLFQSVVLAFSPNGQLQQMILHDNLGQITQIDFTNVTVNNSLSANLFHFQPPPGVDVVSG
jgi:outer membrane lipoprotein carrier protein